MPSARRRCSDLRRPCRPRSSPRRRRSSTAVRSAGRRRRPPDSRASSMASSLDDLRVERLMSCGNRVSLSACRRACSAGSCHGERASLPRGAASAVAGRSKLRPGSPASGVSYPCAPSDCTFRPEAPPCPRPQSCSVSRRRLPAARCVCCARRRGQTGAPIAATLYVAQRVRHRAHLQAGRRPGHRRHGVRHRSIPKTDKVFGPGNAWVTAAKLLVSRDPAGAACDLPAGPRKCW